MLDEALEIHVGFWSWKRFHYSGIHYNVKETRFLPTPVQQPHIPIWVGGYWPYKRPLRLATRSVGVFPLIEVEKESEELAQLERIVSYARQHGGPEEGWDVVCI